MKAVRLLLPLTLMIFCASLLNAQQVATYKDDFQSYGRQANPPGWIDNSIGKGNAVAEGLYKTWPDPKQGNQGANTVYGTKQSSGKPEGRNPRIGTFSTYKSVNFSSAGGFEFRGRIIRTEADSRVGISFFSSYPETDKCYLIGLWSQTTSSKLTMQLFSFGAGVPAAAENGSLDSNVTLDPMKWYRFLVRVDELEGGTRIRARFWPDGSAEPEVFQMNALDNDSKRLTSGRIGLWSAVRGDAFIDDILARSPIDTSGVPVVEFFESGERLNDGAGFNRDVVPDIRIKDDPGAAFTALLDGASYANRTAVSAEGTHTIVVEATGSNGQKGSGQISFFIDKTAPSATLLEGTAPLASGSRFDRTVTLNAAIVDSSQTTIEATLDGDPYTLGTPVSTEAVHQVTLKVTDALNNGPTTVGPISFTIDKSAPVVTIMKGNDEFPAGAAFNTDVAATVSVLDLTPAIASMTLDGEPYVAGTPITTDGHHVLAAQATDALGHVGKAGPIDFIINKGGPSVTLRESGEAFPTDLSINRDAVVTVDVKDIVPWTTTVTIDGAQFTGDGPFTVTTEQSHSISVLVVDTAGNRVSIGPIAFVIDRTPPHVRIVESGVDLPSQVFGRDVTPVIEATDDRPGVIATATLDENEFASGSQVSAEGAHSIAATAKDKAGNTAAAGPIGFTIDKTAPEVRLLESGAPFPAGFWFNRDVNTSLDIDDISATTVEAVLDGAPFTIGTPITIEGNHSISVTAKDAVLHVTEIGPVQFVIDKTAPKLVFTSHKNGDVLTAPQIPVSGTADDSVAVEVNGQQATVDSERHTFASSPTILEGSNTITAVGRDRAGNTGSVSIDVLLDSRAPELGIDLPIEGACIDGGTVEVRGTVSDARVASVTVEAGGSTTNASLDSAGKAWVATVPAAAEGELRLVIRAADTVGHVTTAMRTVRVDRTTPSIEVTSGGTPLVTNTSVNRSLSLFIRGIDASPVQVSSTLDDQPYESGSLISGERAHRLVVTARDCAAHVATRTIDFEIDLTPPSVRDLAPANGARVGEKPLTVAGIVSPDTVKLEIAGATGTIPATPAADGSFSVPVAFTEGVNQLTIRATDRAGNVGELQYRVTVKTNAPPVDIVESGNPISDNAFFNRDVTPEIRSTDSSATLSATLDGAPFTSGTKLSSEKSYELVATATDDVGHSSTARATFSIDKTAPSIKISEPAAGPMHAASADVRGTGADAVAVTVNGAPAVLTNGAFVANVQLEVGENLITAVGTDRAGNSGRDEIIVTRDSGGPGILVTTPSDKMLTNRPTTPVAGRLLTPTSTASVSILVTGPAGQSRTLAPTIDPSGAFRIDSVGLVEGVNTIVASANVNGHSSSISLSVRADFTPPALQILESGVELANESRFDERASITAVSSEAAEIGLTVDGTPVAQPCVITSAGAHTVLGVARDLAGNEKRIERTLFIGSGSGGTGACSITSIDPASGSTIFSRSAKLVGRTTASALKINHVPVEVVDGSFCANVELSTEGDNSISIACTDAGGIEVGTPTIVVLKRVTGEPSVSISSPAEGTNVTTETIDVTGMVGAGVVSLDVNGIAASITSSDVTIERPFEAKGVRLTSGLNVIVAHAQTAAMRTATASRRVTFVKDLASISITSPFDGHSTGADTIDVSGTYRNAIPASITINGGRPASLQVTASSDLDGKFHAEVPLSTGDNTITVTGLDVVNRPASASIRVNRVPGAAAIAISEPLDNSSFGAASADLLVRGTFTAAEGSTIRVNDIDATISANEFSARIPFASGIATTAIVARLSEPSGTSAVDTIKVTRYGDALKVVESFPALNAVQVETSAQLLVLFSAPIDHSSVTSDSFSVLRSDGQRVDGVVRVDRDVLSLVPSAMLAEGERYTIRVDSVRDAGGNLLAQPFTSSFTTASRAVANAPVVDTIPAVVCAESIPITGTAQPGLRVQLVSGSLELLANTDSSGRFSFNYPLTGQSGFRLVRIRTIGSDGSLSTSADVCFRVDCGGPEVKSSEYDAASNRISITFTKAVKPSTLVVGSAESITLTTLDGRSINGSVVVADAIATVTPSENLSTATFTLRVGTAVKDTSSSSLTVPYLQTFTAGNASNPGDGFVSGEVFDAVTGRPLAGATVVAIETARARSTDPKGRYAFALSEGAHTIRVSRSGFTTAWRQIVVSAGTGVVPIDIRLARLGTTATSTGAAILIEDGGDTTITRKAKLAVPAGVVQSGHSITLSSVGAQSLAGLLPLGWSPYAAAEIQFADAPAATAPLTATLTFAVDSSAIASANQTLTLARYDASRDEWSVITPVANIAADGTATVNLLTTGFYALVYRDRHNPPVEPSANAALQGVADPCATATCDSLRSKSFTLDPPSVLPDQTTTATLTIQGTTVDPQLPVLFPSGTAVQAYIDEELRLSDGSRLLDPPFATDLLLYRSLDGSVGIADFQLAPSVRAAKVILEVGYDHINIHPYPSRLDRGTLIGNEGGRVPGDERISIEIPAGSTTEALHAKASTLSDLSGYTVENFEVLGGFELELSRASDTTPIDTDGDGQPDPQPAMSLSKMAAATFAVDAARVDAGSQVVVAEVLDGTSFGRIYRLTSLATPLTSASAKSNRSPREKGSVTVTPSGATDTLTRFTTVVRSPLPLEGIVHEGRYLILKPKYDVAFAYGTSNRAGARLTSSAPVPIAEGTGVRMLGTNDVARVSGIFALPVLATPHGPFSIAPRDPSLGDGVAYQHASAPRKDEIVDVGALTVQPQALTLTSTSPASGAHEIILGSAISASFSADLDRASISNDSIVATDESGRRIAGSIARDSVVRTVTFIPASPLKANSRYTVTVAPSITALTGAPFGRSYVFSFSTVTQIINTQVNRSAIHITIPDANGVSRIFGDPRNGTISGALPQNWTAVAVRRGNDFVVKTTATANADGSFELFIGSGDSRDRVSTTDQIDLHVSNEAGILQSIIPLTPFITNDRKGFIAPVDRETRFTSADSITVVVPAGAFEEPTRIDVAPSAETEFSAVPSFASETDFATSVRLQFDGISKEPLEIEMPVPANIDANRKFILTLLGDSIRGARVVAVDTLRIENGKFTTSLPPATGRLSQKGATTQSEDQESLKAALLRVNRAGTYAGLSIIEPPGSSVGWAYMSGVPTGVDLFTTLLGSFYAPDFYISESHGRIVVPVLTNRQFSVVGVDSSTGLESFSRAYDPLPLADPGAGVPLSNPGQNTQGPFPVSASPFRVEMIDLTISEGTIDSVRNLPITFSNGLVTINSNLPAGTPVEVLNATTGVFDDDKDHVLRVAAKKGDRLILLAGERNVTDTHELSVVFSEPIYLGAAAEDDAIDAFLRTRISLNVARQETAGIFGEFSDVTSQVRFVVDSGQRRVRVLLSGGLQLGSRYRLTLAPTIADISDDGQPGLKLGQAGEFVDNHLQPIGSGKTLDLYFDVRSPAGVLGTFELSDGAVRDEALYGNILFVTALDGGVVALDTSNPAKLSTLAFVPANGAEFWAIASDHHGRVFTTGLGDTFGFLRSYHIEDFLKASEETTTNCGASAHAVCASHGAINLSWRPGYTASNADGEFLTDRPEAYPRKLQVVVQDDETDGLDAIRAIGSVSTTNIDGTFSKFDITIPYDPQNPYAVQRMTVENVTLDLRWSADATPTQPAHFEVIARSGDGIRVLRNRITYGVVSLFGYGIGVYDLNAVESNDAASKPAGYVPIGEQILLTKADGAAQCDQALEPEPCAIQDLTLSPEAAIRINGQTIDLYGIDVHKGLLDVRVTPPRLASDGSVIPAQYQRAAIGLALTAPLLGSESVDTPRIDALRKAWAASPLVAGKAMNVRFSSASEYQWTLDKTKNRVIIPATKPGEVARGIRGSVAGTTVVRDYMLVAARDAGLFVVEVAGDPQPDQLTYDWLESSQLADIIWIPGGAYSVRTIPRTSYATVVDGAGRVLLVDLSRIDERWNAAGQLLPQNELFPTAKASLSLPPSYAGAVGADDPRIIWRSEPGLVTGTLAPVIDPDTGFIFAGNLMDKKIPVVSALDPRVQVKVDLGGSNGLSEVGGVVPLGVDPPQDIQKRIAALEPCTGAATGCRENASLGAFRIEVTLPGSLVESLGSKEVPITGIPMALESELVIGGVSAQTSEPFPPSHLRVKLRNGQNDPRSVALNLRRALPADSALQKSLRHQRGFNKFISPWIIAIADPRASSRYNWGDATEAQKVEAGCFSCSRPVSLRGKGEADGVFEIYSSGRVFALRPEATGATSTVFSGTPYAYLNDADRMIGRFATVPADTIRTPDALVAAQNPPVASGAIQETVYLHSGELETGAVDLNAGGRAGWNVIFDRTYRSRTIGASPLGFGWTSSIFRHLRPLPNGDVEYVDGAGETWRFVASGGLTNAYVSPRGLFLKLARKGDGWVLYDQKWRMTVFDNIGRLSAEADEFSNVDVDAIGTRQGNVIQYLYGADGKLVNIVDPVGRASSIEYWGEGDTTSNASPGMLRRIADWRGRTVEYEYDPTGRLARVLLPAAKAADSVPAEYDHTGAKRPAIQYSYDSSSGTDFRAFLELGANLNAIHDPQEVATHGSARVTFVYGNIADGLQRDRVIEEHAPCGQFTTACQDVVSTVLYKDVRTVETKDMLEQSRSYTLTDPGTEGRVHIAIATEQRVPMIDTGSALPPKAVPALSSTLHDVTTWFKYSPQGQWTNVDDSNNSHQAFTYERAENGAPGTRVSEIRRRGLDAAEAVTRVDYPESGDVNTAQAVAKRDTGEFVSREATSPSRHRRTIEREDVGVKRVADFDEHGRPTTAKALNGSEITASHSTSYHPDSSVKAIERGEVSVSTSGEDVGTRYEYSPLEGGGAVVVTTDVLTNAQTTVESDSQDRPVHVVVKNSAGDLLSERWIGYDASGRLTYSRQHQKDVGDVTTTAIYDPLSRVRTMTSDKAIVDGQLVTLTATNEYDLANHTVTQQTPHSGSAAARTVAEIDSLGRTRRVVTEGASGEKISREFGYDLFGNQNYESDGVRIATLTMFDAFGRELRSVNADGQSAQTTWNAWGEPVETRSFSRGGAMTSNQRSVFTSKGRLRASNEEIAVDGPARQTRFGWDDGDRTQSTRLAAISSVSIENFPADTVARVTESVRDIAGRTIIERTGVAAGISTPLGSASPDDPEDPSRVFSALHTKYRGSLPESETTFEPIAGTAYHSASFFDALGRTTRTVFADGLYESSQSYDESGNVVERHQPGMAAERYSYDARGLVTSRTASNGESTTYAYDEYGSVTRFVDEANETTKYENDGLGRPARVTYPDGTFEETRYEIGTGVVAATRDRAGAWLSYKYDPAGRLIEIHSGEVLDSSPLLVLYTYDGAGRLQSTRNATSAIEYGDYDLLGRVGTTRTYRYDGGTGFAETPALLDVHTQKHEWNVFGERSAWSMPVNGISVPAADSAAIPWLQTIVEEHDGAGNIIAQRKRGGGTLSTAVARGAGRLSSRSVVTAAGLDLTTNFGFEDGTVIPATSGFEGVAAKLASSGLPSWASTRSGSGTLAGSKSSYDNAMRVGRVDSAGIFAHSSIFGYDGKGRLQNTVLLEPSAKAGAAAGQTDTYVPADFLSTRTVPPLFTADQNLKLGLSAQGVQPPSWTATKKPASEIDKRTILLAGLPDVTQAYSFEGGRRKGDGTWTYAYDALGRLISMESRALARRITFEYDPNGRIVGRSALTLDGEGKWSPEARAEVLSGDGLPAETTLVWDPITDRLIAIFEKGASTKEGHTEYSGLLRQYLHGDQGYDDPTEVLVRKSGTEVEHYYPLVDRNGGGSIQAVAGADGKLVERILFADAWGGAPRYQHGPIVEKVEVSASKDGDGKVTEVNVRAVLTDRIEPETAVDGFAVSVVKTDGSPAAAKSGTVSVESARPNVVRWHFTADEWNALTSSGEAEALRIEVTGALRSAVWPGSVTPAPEWAGTLYSVSSEAGRPWFYTESLDDVRAQVIDRAAAGGSRTSTLYEIPSLYAAADEDSTTKLLTGFKAAPFVEPANGYVYLRDRWYDGDAGVFLTLDAYGTKESSNVFAFCANDPVNCSDPLGTFGIDNFGPIDRLVTGWMSEKYVSDPEFAAATDAALDVSFQVLNSPRVQGTMQVLGGCSEAALGAIAIPATEGVGAVPGWVAVVHGADICGAGLRTLLSGEAAETLTKKAAQAGLVAFGVDATTADMTSTYIDLGVSLYGTAGSSRVLLGLSRESSISSSSHTQYYLRKEAAYQRYVKRALDRGDAPIGKRAWKRTFDQRYNSFTEYVESLNGPVQNHHLVTNRMRQALNRVGLPGDALRARRSLQYLSSPGGHVGYQQWHIDYDKHMLKFIAQTPGLDEETLLREIHDYYQAGAASKAIPGVGLGF